jgi:hypothetical protein
MATPVIISLLIGLVAGGAFMAMWAANRIEEESVRQFDRGFERGRWLVAGARQPASPPTRPPGQEPRPSLLVLP